MKQRHFIYLIFSIFFVFCSKTETEWSIYLKKLKIHEDENKIFLLIPAKQCAGCFNYNGSLFSDSVNDKIVVINAHPKAQILNFKNIVLDKENLQSSLSFYTSTNLLITNKRGGMVATRVYDLKQQIDSILKTVE